MRLTNLLVLAALAGAPLIARADACPPTAVIGGPANAAQVLTKALVARGVQIEPAGLPAGPCPALDVQVTREAGSFHVRITDPWGRRVDRTLADVLTAATLIETWARMDLLTSTETSTAASGPLAPSTPEVAAAPVAADPAPVAVTDAPPVEAAAAADELESKAPVAAPAVAVGVESSTLLVALRGEVGLGRDRAVWGGSAVSACVRLGVACAGLLGRFAMSDEGLQRVDALGLLALPLTFDRLSLTPAIGVGAGFQSKPDIRFGGGRRGRDFVRGNGNGSSDDAQLRVEARLDLAYRFSDHFSATVGASASAAPDFGRGGSALGAPEDQIVRAQLGLMWGVP